MAKKYSQLPPAGTGADSDLYAISQGPTTFKQTRAQLRTAILAAWQPFIRTMLAAADAAAARLELLAAKSGANDDITSLTGLTTPLSVAQGGTNRTTLATVITNFLAATTAALARTAITAASSGANSDITSLTGLTTPLSVAQGGTNRATVALFAGDLAAVKLAWTSYSPTITSASGTFTSVTAVTGSYMAAGGICYFRVIFTVTTKGTGANPIVPLPLPALAGSSGMPIPTGERAVNGKAGMAYIQSGLATALVVGADAIDLVSADGANIVVMGSYPIA